MDDSEDEEATEKEDEKPTVVVLRSGDLTAEEAAKAEIEQKEREDRELIEKGKITFKSQKKRSTATEQDTDAQSNNKKAKKENSVSKSDSSRSSAKKSSLLSFDDEEEDE